MATTAWAEGYRVLYHWEKFSEERLLTLLAKSDVWNYEKEYRLIVQEESKAFPDTESLKSNGNFLASPEGALMSVITGCQSDHARIHDLVKSVDPTVHVKQAIRVPLGCEKLWKAIEGKCRY